ncbi:MAG: Crp/Fnr family transcriptional regulator [Desulfovibrio sp.]|nr:Crp/Fnr family transcriptional regulator [Desulfovibrio sp.]
MEKHLPILRLVRLFTGIEEDAIPPMLNCLGARTKTYRKDAFVLHAGSRPEGLGLVLSGSLFIMHVDHLGNRELRAHIPPCGIFAENFACAGNAEMDVSVIADVESEIMWLDVGRILTTCTNACQHHTRMIRNLFADIARANLLLNEKLTHVSRRSTREKLLSYLWAESRRQGSTEFSIPFNRQELADYLCVDRSAMSAELSRMRKDGLLLAEKNKFALS